MLSKRYCKLLLPSFSFFLLLLFSIHILQVALHLVLEVLSLLLVILDESCAIALVSDSLDARLKAFFVCSTDITLKVLTLVERRRETALIET